MGHMAVYNSSKYTKEDSAMNKHSYPPFTIPGAHAAMKRICKEKLQALYGTNPPECFVERLDDELTLAGNGNISSIYMLLHRLSAHLREEGGQIGIRGTLSSTLISFLLGITDINPLPAHYRCPNCGYTTLVGKDSGYELPQDTCPNCDTSLVGDGHDIPYEACLQLVQGNPTETVDINVSASTWEKAVRFLVKFLGEKRIACASEWNNPVCFLLLSEGMRFEDITPTAELELPVCGVRKQTVLPGYELTPIFLRLILLPHDDYDRIRCCIGLPEQNRKTLITVILTSINYFKILILVEFWAPLQSAARKSCKNARLFNLTTWSGSAV